MLKVAMNVIKMAEGVQVIVIIMTIITILIILILIIVSYVTLYSFCPAKDLKTRKLTLTGFLFRM